MRLNGEAKNHTTTRRRNARKLLRALIEGLEKRTLLTVPVVSDFSFNFESTHTLTLDITPDMRPGQPQVNDGLTSTDLIVEKVTTDTNVAPSSILLSYPAPGNHATFSFTGIPGSVKPDGSILTDGNYRASISKQDLVHNGDAMAVDAIRDFWVLAGDITGAGGMRDRQVNLSDYNRLAGNFGMTGATYSQGDLNYDGNINLSDFNLLAGNFGLTLYAPAVGSGIINVDPQADGTLRASWDASAAGNNTQWRIQMSVDGQTFTTYAHVDASQGFFIDDGDGNPAPGGPGLTEGARRWYRVRAVNGNPESAYTPKRSGTTPLRAASNLIVAPASATAMDLSWTNNSATATEFIVERSNNGGASYITLATRPAHSPFRDTGLTPGATYHYKITATNGTTNSAPTLPVSATTFATGLNTLTAQVTSSEELNFTWTPVPGATSYRVEASWDGQVFDEVGEFADGLDAEFIQLDVGQRTFARVVALNGVNQLGISNIAGATTSLTAPDAPGFLSAVITSPTSNQLTWVDADDLEDGFIIERSTNGGASFDEIGHAVANSQSFTDATASSSYQYRVKSFNYLGSSGYSNVAIPGPGDGGGGDDEQEIVQQDILVSFFGAGQTDIRGNEWLEEISDAAGGTLQGPPYRDYEGRPALTQLLDAIDQNNNHVITAAEIAAVDVRMLSWSWGGVTAVNVSRRLTKTTGMLIGYRLMAEVPVETMFLIDYVHSGLPRKIRWAWGPVKNNVNMVHNYYTQRQFQITHIPYYVGNFLVGSDAYDGFFRGTTVRTSSGVAATQVRVDTAWQNVEKRHNYRPRGQTAIFEGRLLGGQTNHATLVWYTQDEALAAL